MTVMSPVGKIPKSKSKLKKSKKPFGDDEVSGNPG
jgi:hypothetical protein